MPDDAKSSLILIITVSCSLRIGQFTIDRVRAYTCMSFLHAADKVADAGVLEVRILMISVS